MVQTSPKTLREYVTPDGQNHFAGWFNALRDIRAKASILARLARIREGNVGDCKTVGGGVQEMRIDFGPGYRVYFGQNGDTLVILLSGGDKSGQARDIETARNLWAAYRREKP